MKKINWKTLVVTCIICLLPALLGAFFYDRLPQQIAGHFNINNEPDMFFSKNLALFGIPVFMMVLQAVMCIINDLCSHYKSGRPRIEIIFKWLIPIMSLILYPIMLSYTLGAQTDIRRIVCFTVGLLIAVTGNYLPKISYEQRKGMRKYPMPKDESSWRKMSRAFGYTFTFTGLLLAASILLPASASVAALAVMIISMLAVTLYSICLSRQ